MGVFMSTLDVGIINVTLPTLVQSFQTTFPQAQWAVLSYSLVSSSLVLAATRLGDMWGKKHLYLGGMVIFTLSSLLCGLAPSINWLIGFRGLQGLGSVFLSGLGLAIITEVFPSSERGRAVGIIGSVVSLGVALGPSTGGLLLGLAGWRSVFLINVPLGIIASFLVARVVPRSPQVMVKQKFDLVGAFLALVTLGSFALGMTQGQRQGFGSESALSLLAIASVGLVTFLLLEVRLKHPLLELYLFRNLRLSMSLLSNVLVFIVLSGVLLVTPFFLERVQNYSTLKVGLLLAVPSVISGLVAPISGTLSDRFGSRLMGLVGLGLMIGGCLGISTFNAQLTEWGYVLPYFLYGLGLGFFRSPNDSTVMGAVPRERLGIASGLLSLSRTCGVTMGISIIGAVFGSISAQVAGGIDAAAAPPAAIIAGFQGTFRVAALILCGAAVASALRFHQSKQM
ncbi:DHA2 family efflux MFS transporter permease subunit [Richelia sinica FACHB-800]|nr:DHA2 family efflux MFS transporter permease subunit [Richelia sinica FACHB-800]